MPVISIILLLTAYVGIYSFASIRGDYTTMATPIMSGEYYEEWTPAGFTNEKGDGNGVMRIIFYPLLKFDRHYIHTYNTRNLLDSIAEDE